MASAWWRERQVLRSTARDLTAEFEALHVDGASFGVRARGRRTLELLVWSEGGVDTFRVHVDGLSTIGHACEDVREIVARYAVGRRPPFA